MAINPTGPISTPILTYATPAQRKAVGQENEEDKARPLPPVEEGQQSEASANRRRDPNRIEDELPDEDAPKRQATTEAAEEQADDQSEEPSRSHHLPSSASPNTTSLPLLESSPVAIDDLLDLAAKGLKYKDSDGVK